MTQPIKEKNDMQELSVVLKRFDSEKKEQIYAGIKIAAGILGTAKIGTDQADQPTQKTG